MAAMRRGGWLLGATMRGCRCRTLVSSQSTMHNPQLLAYRALVSSTAASQSKQVSIKDAADKNLKDMEAETHRPEDEPRMGFAALHHPIWPESDLHDVKITHMQPKGIVDHMAYYSVKGICKGFDILSGFNKVPRQEKAWLHRVIFLETVGAAPCMAGAIMRHLQCLSRMQLDNGLIHTMIEEAENERIHLMTALYLKKPSWMFRQSVVVAQGIFVTFFSIAYLFSPRYCHRFIGYLEEEAVIMYTQLLEDMDGGSMEHWKHLPAPPLAISYWQLPETAKMYDVILVIRADEAHHRAVNHTLGSMKPGDSNPFKPKE